MTARLEMRSVSLSLGKRRIIGGASFTLNAGEFVGVVGPNGAGKTTLLRAAAGLIAPDDGEVLLDGAPLAALPLKERARRLAYLPQQRPVYWPVPARAVVALGRFAFGDAMNENASDDAAIARALADAGAAHLGDRLVTELSGGELSRIHFARMLAGETPTIIADEPAAALDPAQQFAVMGLLRKKAGAGCAVMAALHELPLAARYCTRIIIVKEGRILKDAPPMEAFDAETLRDSFGVSGAFAEDGLRLSPA